MDFAVRLALSIAERTWPSWQARQGQLQHDGYSAYPLRGGSELWNLQLSHAPGKEKENAAESVSVPVSDLFLSFSDRQAALPRVSLVPSGTKRLRRALRHIAQGFEFSLTRPAAAAASGILSFALAVLAGGSLAGASVSSLPGDSSRAVQCQAAQETRDSLLADISQPARHRVFSRARDRLNNKVANHSNTINVYNDTSAGGHNNINYTAHTNTGHNNTNPWSNHINAFSNDPSMQNYEFRHVNVVEGDYVF